NYEHAQQLLELAPNDSAGEKLMNGIQEGLRGRSLSELPEDLVRAMEPFKASGEGEYAMDLRQKKSGVLESVLEVIQDSKADLNHRLSYIRILGEVEYPEAIPALLGILRRPALQESKAVKITILHALQRYTDPEIAKGVLGAYPGVLREDQ